MSRRTIVATSGLILAVSGFVDANAQVAPNVQPTLVCGLEVYASPIGFPEPEPTPDPQSDPASPGNASGDPCLDGETVFGPVRFERHHRFPKSETVDFTLDTAGDVCITSQVSDFKQPAKAFPFIELDGEHIAGPWNFRDLFDEQIHGLAAGPHELGVLIFGRRGSYLDVEFRQIISGGGGGDPGLPAPGEVQIDPETGALDMVSDDGSVRLQNVATDHPLLNLNGGTTLFQALTTPLVPLPGEDDGTVAYFLDWEFQIVDLATCNTIDTGLVGSTQIHSPTLAEIVWDGTDITGVPVQSGNYTYIAGVKIVDEFGALFGSITAPGFGLVIDLTSVDYDERAEILPQCDAATDPDACRCPGVDGVPGTPDPNCGFSFVRDLLPGGSFPFGSTPNYYNPSALDLSFITTTLDPVTGRYTVTVDLREQDAMGLVPKGSGIWDSEASLRQWVSQMTGVPVPEVDANGDSLFNFDYVQIGTSTGVNLFGLTFQSFNHFLLDAITNDFGQITVDGLTTDLGSLFNDDDGAPAQYVVTGREYDECKNNGNTDGSNVLRSKFCAYNTAVSIGNETDLGVYALRTTMFDLKFNTDLTKQDTLCVIDDFYHCGVRTNAVPADVIEIEASYYKDDGTGAEFTRTEITTVSGVDGVSTTVDRGNGEDGVCARTAVVRDGLAVRMDAADGSVPDSCIINGIF